MFSQLLVVLTLNIIVSQTIEVLECGESTLTGLSGNITSPNYPNFYPSNLYCRWTIIAPENTVLVIEFVDINIEYSLSCQFDQLECYDGDNLYYNRPLCGTEEPRSFAASFSNVTIILKTDNTVENTGFHISWTTEPKCEDNEFTCWNGSCISSSLKCDGKSDCPKGRDEVECAHIQSNQQCGNVVVPPLFISSARIVGGNSAVPGSWPWQAMLIDRATFSLVCGASIISDKYIITAAHCFEHSNPDYYLVAVGRTERNGNSNEQIVSVKRIIKHPDYIDATFTADITILELTGNINFSKPGVEPICLPVDSHNNDSVRIEEGTTCFITGWGALASNYDPLPTTLQQARVEILNLETCNARYSEELFSVTTMQICAGSTLGGVDSCQGDSGGPLVCLINDRTWFQFGITSFGIGCANKNYPGVYTYLPAYSDWIQNITGVQATLPSDPHVTTQETSTPASTTTPQTTADSTTLSFITKTIYVFFNTTEDVLQINTSTSTTGMVISSTKQFEMTTSSTNQLGKSCILHLVIFSSYVFINISL